MHILVGCSFTYLDLDIQEVKSRITQTFIRIVKINKIE